MTDRPSASMPTTRFGRTKPSSALTQDRFAALLADHADPDHLHERLLAAERRNLGHYGFGVKGFTLSMIETAIEVTDGRVPATVIAELIAAGREMLAHPDRPSAPCPRQPSTALAARLPGDPDHQGRPSGSGTQAGAIGPGRSVPRRSRSSSDKTAAAYRAIFARHGTGADQAMMVGNSLKSDVIPALAGRGLGRACAPWPDLGAGSRRSADRITRAFTHCRPWRTCRPCGQPCSLTTTASGSVPRRARYGRAAPDAASLQLHELRLQSPLDFKGFSDRNRLC